MLNLVTFSLNDFGFLRKLAILGLLLMSILSSVGLSVFANNSDCDVGQVEVRWWQIASPASFLPVIPANCATEDGVSRPRPLSLNVLPDVLIRLFGFVVSLVWLMLLPTVIFAGIWYTWGGFDGQVGDKPLSLLRSSFLSIMVLFLFYVGVFTILNLLQADFLETNIKDFFN